MRANLPAAKRVTFRVSGMSCGSCVRHIRKALNELAGVNSSDVNLTAREVTIVFDPAMTGVEAIASAIRKSGYAAEAPNEHKELDPESQKG